MQAYACQDDNCQSYDFLQSRVPSNETKKQVSFISRMFRLNEIIYKESTSCKFLFL